MTSVNPQALQSKCSGMLRVGSLVPSTWRPGTYCRGGNELGMPGDQGACTCWAWLAGMSFLHCFQKALNSLWLLDAGQLCLTGITRAGFFWIVSSTTFSWDWEVRHCSSLHLLFVLTAVNWRQNVPLIFLKHAAEVWGSGCSLAYSSAAVLALQSL